MINKKSKSKFGKLWRRAKITLGVVLALNAAAIPATYIANQSIEPKGKTVVFSNTNSIKYNVGGGPLTYMSDFFMYPVVVLSETRKGNRVEWYTNATREKILEKLGDDESQNVVFIGHGSKGNYNASNGRVTARDVFESDHSIENKTGRIRQYTCGADSHFTLCDMLAENGDKCETPEGIVWPWTIYIKNVKDIWK